MSVLCSWSSANQRTVVFFQHTNGFKLQILLSIHSGVSEGNKILIDLANRGLLWEDISRGIIELSSLPPRDVFSPRVIILCSILILLVNTFTFILRLERTLSDQHFKIDVVIYR